MFKGNSNMATNNNNNPERLNRIVEGTIIQGEVNCDSNIRIDGKLKGNLNTTGRLLIGPKGEIEGEIICASADIEGSVTGIIKVKELLSLKATSKLKGDIIAGKLSIEPGAVFAGSCNMGGVVKDIKQPKKEETVLQENIG